MYSEVRGTRGNSEPDHTEYGYGWPSAGERLRALRDGIRRIKARLPTLNPPPIGPLPVLIGGGGERVTLRLVAEFADMSNAPGPPEVVRQKNRVLDEWCDRVGRPRGAVERTCNISVAAIERMHEWVEAGAQRLQIQLDHPFDLKPVETALRLRG